MGKMLAAKVAVLTKIDYGRMVAVHGNSCAEVRSSKLQALSTPLKRVFLRSAHERIYGAFTRHFCAPFPVLGLLTCKRLTIIFRRIWRGLNVQADTMNTPNPPNFNGMNSLDLARDVQLYTYLLGEQLNALELVLEATICERADSFSRAIMCQTSNIFDEFKHLEGHVNALLSERGEACSR